MTSLTVIFFIILCVGLLAFGIVVCLDYDWWRNKDKSQHKKTEEKNNQEKL